MPLLLKNSEAEYFHGMPMPTKTQKYGSTYFAEENKTTSDVYQQ
jgi:hypothetical protein